MSDYGKLYGVPITEDEDKLARLIGDASNPAAFEAHDHRQRVRGMAKIPFWRLSAKDIPVPDSGHEAIVSRAYITARKLIEAGYMYVSPDNPARHLYAYCDETVTAEDLEGMLSRGDIVAHGTAKLPADTVVSAGIDTSNLEYLGTLVTSDDLSLIKRSLLKEVQRGVVTDTLWVDAKCPETIIDFIDALIERQGATHDT